jgi:hypothetical protein
MPCKERLCAMKWCDAALRPQTWLKVTLANNFGQGLQDEITKETIHEEALSAVSTRSEHGGLGYRDRIVSRSYTLGSLKELFSDSPLCQRRQSARDRRDENSPMTCNPTLTTFPKRAVADPSTPAAGGFPGDVTNIVVLLGRR